ncbi:hypothetical protein [Vallitalea guaymasensis]|uniref:Uncharacterized protein n=1 Tax=Vallitalea guaymasensis TaxID=1185412 RepID=A0A8J8SAZ1_9FIRM|nr:hypothetical protein [Vallitalea guaymasensis]QUH28089.1 hypothetical protein HYG85_03825 [Vallitalea guaymasensis]
MKEQEKYGLFLDNELSSLTSSFDIRSEDTDDLPIAAAAAGPEGAGAAAAAPEAFYAPGGQALA